MPTLPAERLAAPGSLSWLDRIRLTKEISDAHRRVKRAQGRTEDVRAVLAEIRDEPLSGAGPPQPRAVAGRLGNAVSRAMPRLPADSRCLAQSLVLSDLLARRGIASTLVIGVNNDDSKFGAHAWVELDGDPLLEPGEFGRLAEL